MMKLVLLSNDHMLGGKRMLPGFNVDEGFTRNPSLPIVYQNLGNYIDTLNLVTTMAYVAEVRTLGTTFGYVAQNGIDYVDYIYMKNPKPLSDVATWDYLKSIGVNFHSFTQGINYAIVNNLPKVFGWMLENVKDLNATDTLTNAMSYHNGKYLDRLLRLGVAPMGNNKDVLFYAAKENEVSMLKIFEKKGYGLTATDLKEKNVLFSIASRGALATLSHYNAFFDLMMIDSTLFSKVASLGSQRLDILRWLLGHYEIPVKELELGLTYAVELGHSEVIELINTHLSKSEVCE
jgi:hypothetical protein